MADAVLLRQGSYAQYDLSRSQPVFVCDTCEEPVYRKPGRGRPPCGPTCGSCRDRSRWRARRQPLKAEIGVPLFTCVQCAKVVARSGRRGKVPVGPLCSKCRCAHFATKRVKRPEPRQFTCEQCGASCSSSAVSARFCSDGCRKASYAATLPFFECRWCNRAFQPKRHDRTQFCSRECSYARWAAERKAREQQKRVSWQRVCECCGAGFEAKRQRQYCGDACRLELARTRARAEYREKVAVGFVPEIKRCRECHAAYASRCGDRGTAFCSTDCSGKAARRRGRVKRKALLKGATVETVDPTTVFERDKWRCQLCGTRTPKKRRGTLEPNAPELDHIIPLSLGGEHSYRNTQCACRACNHAKGATTLGQLRLFG